MLFMLFIAFKWLFYYVASFGFFSHLNSKQFLTAAYLLASFVVAGVALVDIIITFVKHIKLAQWLLLFA